ncbi:hypothetical protein [Oligoflexus tunisiensis]|uniref:hypothetical protein n=1 Tax=Oligoflexus tunisiensis TaxID=708132 RepID=UPI00114D04CF|nr:hypothetical protein [Oligoflexus tunisiensis]
MNKSLQVLTILASLSTQAAAQEAVEFPSRLICDAVGDCIAGLENFCEADFYFPEPVVMEQPAQYSGSTYDPTGELSEEELLTMVKLDFSEGDQYSFYFFKASAMTQLARGEIDKIQGTYEDGFDWTNGYNTRARFRVECVRGL